MTRSDTWECDVCGKKTEGRFPSTWATLSAEIGKGWIATAHPATHVCSARCGAAMLVGLYERARASDAAAVKA